MKKSIIFSGVLFSLLFGGIFLFAVEVKADIMGDANGDCNVDILDLVFVRNKLGRDVNILDNQKADVNGDGRIDILDFVFVRNHLGETCPPDPGSHQIIDLEPGWSVISTPKVISSYEFSVPETAEYLDIRLLDSSFPSGWATMQEIGQTKFEPLYGYFLYNKTNELQTLRLNYYDNLTPDQRLFKRTLQPGWNTIGIANPNYALQKGTGNIDTDNVSKILDSIIDSTGLVIDFTAYEEDLDSVKMGDFWASKITSQVNDLNDFRELKSYGVFITKTTDYTGFQNVGEQAGSLSISLSSSSPATGNISAGDDIVLGIFDFEAKGEEVKVTALDLNFTYAVGLGDTDVTNVVLVDKNGTTVCGPADVGSTTAGEAVFTDTFIVPVGINEYTVKVSLADSASNGDQLQVGVKGPTASVAAQGMTSNETIAPTPAGNQNANNMTVAAATLEVRTLGAPAARSLPSGLSDFVFATFSFDAGASGEDVQITAITVTDSVSGAAAGTDVDNAELWADLTDGTSSRGDVYETKISDTEQWTGAAGNASSTAYTLNQTLTIPKTTSVRMALVSDIVSGATGSHVFFIDASGDVTSNGAETGESTTVTVNHTSKQTMTLATSGALTVTKDSSTPVTGIVIGGKTATLGVFRLSANNVESLDLDQITITILNGNYIDTLYFYEGDTLLGSVVGATLPTKYFNDGTLTIPANGNRKITVKAKLSNVDGVVVKNDTPIKVSLDTINAVETTGLASGASIKSGSQIVHGNEMYIFKTRPYFSLNASSPSGDLFPSETMPLAIFDVTAEDTEDVTFTQADSNAIRMMVNMSLADTDSNRMLFVLKDEDGNTLEDDIELQDSFALGVISAAIDINFEDKEFVVPAGETKKLYLYGDTSMLEDDGDFIQVWLDDDVQDIYWGINGVTAENFYTRGDIIFRGDIYGGSFVNPS